MVVVVVVFSLSMQQSSHNQTAIAQGLNHFCSASSTLTLRDVGQKIFQDSPFIASVGVHVAFQIFAFKATLTFIMLLPLISTFPRLLTFNTFALLLNYAQLFSSIPLLSSLNAFTVGASGARLSTFSER
jgi:hypothetical protein